MCKWQLVGATVVVVDIREGVCAASTTTTMRTMCGCCSTKPRAKHTRRWLCRAKHWCVHAVTARALHSLQTAEYYCNGPLITLFTCAWHVRAGLLQVESFSSLQQVLPGPNGVWLLYRDAPRELSAKAEAAEAACGEAPLRLLYWDYASQLMHQLPTAEVRLRSLPAISCRPHACCVQLYAFHRVAVKTSSRAMTQSPQLPCAVLVAVRFCVPTLNSFLAARWWFAHAHGGWCRGGRVTARSQRGAGGVGAERTCGGVLRRFLTPRKHEG